jgi:hypothetical protein
MTEKNKKTQADRCLCFRSLGGHIRTQGTKVPFADLEFGLPKQTQEGGATTNDTDRQGLTLSAYVTGFLVPLRKKKQFLKASKNIFGVSDGEETLHR